jgi:hypothetical protein
MAAITRAEVFSLSMEWHEEPVTREQAAPLEKAGFDPGSIARKSTNTLFVDPGEVELRDKAVDMGGLPSVMTVTCRKDSGVELHLFVIHGFRWISDSRVSVAWSVSKGPLSGLGAEMVMEWQGTDWKFVERINSYIS